MPALTFTTETFDHGSWLQVDNTTESDVTFVCYPRHPDHEVMVSEGEGTIAPGATAFIGLWTDGGSNAIAVLTEPDDSGQVFPLSHRFTENNTFRFEVLTVDGPEENLIVEWDPAN